LIPTTQPTRVSAPTKAHLNDGSLIIFKDGFTIGKNKISGTGMLYSIERVQIKTVYGVGLDTVAFMEYYVSQVEGNSVLAALLGPLVFAGGLANERIKKAIFGSCPTIYSHDGENYSLQAECFSYSICPLAEARDLDRIDGGQPHDNEYKLKITNEALETHYINQLTLKYIDHSTKYEAYPTDDQEIILFGPDNLVERAYDRNGTEITELVNRKDSIWFQSDSGALNKLTEQITEDWIELELRKPPEANQVILALRIRNTLLNTVLFYDVMLGSAGIKALDWMAGKNLNPVYAWNFNRWYSSHFGLRVQIWNGREFETVQRFGDCGPIAWRQVAINLEIPDIRELRIRLAFLPDNWMIDWVGVSEPVDESPAVYQANCRSLNKTGREKTEIDPGLIIEADDAYLVTYPADVYQAVYQVAERNPDLIRTYFLESQGYYIEWIRSKWFNSYKGEISATEFKLDDSTIIHTAQLWQSKKESFEQDFFSSKISRPERY
jgi:hypothetical protein